MRHYVCIGDCVGVASQPGVCQTEGCTHEGKPLITCGCNDEMHDEAFEKANSHEGDKGGAAILPDESDPTEVDLDDIAEEELVDDSSDPSRD